MKPLQRAIYDPAGRDRQIQDICLSFQRNAAQTRKLCGLGDNATREDCVQAMLAVLDDETKHAEVWKNDQYQVALRRFENTKDGPALVHLSIKRLDKAPCRDWRDFQQIKNQLVGPECEGVELYPAESRVVDTANQFHAWIIDSKTFRFPLGFSIVDTAKQYEGNLQDHLHSIPQVLCRECSKRIAEMAGTPDNAALQRASQSQTSSGLEQVRSASVSDGSHPRGLSRREFIRSRAVVSGPHTMRIQCDEDCRGGTTSRQTPQPSNPQENVRGPTAALGIAQKTGESTPFHDTAPQNEAGGIGTKTHRGKQAQDEPCSEVKASANSDTGRNREGASETQTGETHASMVQQNPCRVDWTKVEQAAPEAYRRGFEEGVATALKAREVAESYHLWVIDSPAFRFPLGYTVGAKIDPTPGTASQQRPFEGAA